MINDYMIYFNLPSEYYEAQFYCAVYIGIPFSLFALIVMYLVDRKIK